MGNYSVICFLPILPCHKGLLTLVVFFGRSLWLKFALFSLCNHNLNIVSNFALFTFSQMYFFLVVMKGHLLRVVRVMMSRVRT